MILSICGNKSWIFEIGMVLYLHGLNIANKCIPSPIFQWFPTFAILAINLEFLIYYLQSMHCNRNWYYKEKWARFPKKYFLSLFHRQVPKHVYSSDSNCRPVALISNITLIPPSTSSTSKMRFTNNRPAYGFKDRQDMVRFK